MYMKNVKDGELNRWKTVGYVGIKKAHNKRSEGEYAVEFLKEAVEMAEEMDMESVWLFTDVHEFGEQKAGLLALCDSPADDKAIVVAGIGYE